MPHQCVVCSTFYDDGAQEILKGCPCGGKLFFYIKKSNIEKAKKITEEAKLTEIDKKQIEQDVRELAGEEDNETPVVLDLEAVKVIKPGKYELDLLHLFKGEPLIFKLEEGKYIVDLIQSFKNLKKEG
ncbi:hypothetical protein CMO89_00995 [Candidatus Woesearchaeota archaeon]|jgi:hypothetical protein|nr:hypothetical protein [Candidatus Woesearchaeota archaeon]|tara:strand:+ start:8512 stop:8895 length:384 start_codon:yes stop_codon:yes gene_type:complete